MAAFPFNACNGAVSGEYPGSVGQGEQFFLDALYQQFLISPGQVGSSHSFKKEGVSGKEFSTLFTVEAYAPFGMTGGVENLEITIKNRFVFIKKDVQVRDRMIQLFKESVGLTPHFYKSGLVYRPGNWSEKLFILWMGGNLDEDILIKVVVKNLAQGSYVVQMPMGQDNSPGGKILPCHMCYNLIRVTARIDDETLFFPSGVEVTIGA